jgi:hypothetical protein
VVCAVHDAFADLLTALVGAVRLAKTTQIKINRRRQLRHSLRRMHGTSKLYSVDNCSRMHRRMTHEYSCVTRRVLHERACKAIQWEATPLIKGELRWEGHSACCACGRSGSAWLLATELHGSVR